MRSRGGTAHDRMDSPDCSHRGRTRSHGVHRDLTGRPMRVRKSRALPLSVGSGAARAEYPNGGGRPGFAAPVRTLRSERDLAGPSTLIRGGHKSAAAPEDPRPNIEGTLW